MNGYLHSFDRIEVAGCQLAPTSVTGRLPVFGVAGRCSPFSYRSRLAVASIIVLFLAACSDRKDNSAAIVDSAATSRPITAPQKSAAGVRLGKTDKGWELLRNGSPYFIKGAGGD